MASAKNREVHLRRYPVGIPSADDFALVETPVPAPQEEEVLVRNLYMSVDPYMRGRMTQHRSYTAGFQLGQPLDGGCVGQVVESHHEHLEVGDYVLGGLGWRDYYASPGANLTRIDPELAPIQSYLGTMGMPGMTAYVGLLDIGRPEPGNTVFVSAASGAVGSVVCQIARIKGCRVVASAGSDAKTKWLVETARVDAAFNYKEVEDLNLELGQHCPDGVDVYFDNVGGAHLEAALDHMNTFGAIVLCGMISQYNATEPMPGPRNLIQAVGKQLRLQGFIVSSHADRRAQFLSDMASWIRQGDLKYRETIRKGIENAPGAFISLFRGENFGKMLVQLNSE